MSQAITVIVNSGARQADDDVTVARLSEAFVNSGMRAEIRIARNGTEIVQLARQGARDASSAVVAAGGDGTINAVATELIGTTKPLGVLPLGTLNHFAKDLNIPSTVEEAVRVLAARHAIDIDVGEVNGRYFLNNSGLGLYPRLVTEREQQQAKGRNKWLAFFSAMLIVLHRYPLLSIRLSADGHEFLRRTPMVFIGNNQYEIQGLNIGSRKCINAGMLSLYVTRQTGRWGFFKQGLKALLGKLNYQDEFDAMCVQRLWVQASRKRLRVALDGEVTEMRLPLEYRVRPAALRVIVPADKPAEAAM